MLEGLHWCVRHQRLMAPRDMYRSVSCSPWHRMQAQPSCRLAGRGEFDELHAHPWAGPKPGAERPGFEGLAAYGGCCHGQLGSRGLEARIGVEQHSYRLDARPSPMPASCWAKGLSFPKKSSRKEVHMHMGGNLRHAPGHPSTVFRRSRPEMQRSRSSCSARAGGGDAVSCPPETARPVV